jgi:hypothetical protein
MAGHKGYDTDALEKEVLALALRFPRHPTASFVCRSILLALIGTALVTPIAIAQKTVSFHTDDGGVIFADLYGPGERYARVRRLMVT